MADDCYIWIRDEGIYPDDEDIVLKRGFIRELVNYVRTLQRVFATDSSTTSTEEPSALLLPFLTEKSLQVMVCEVTAAILNRC